MPYIKKEDRERLTKITDQIKVIDIRSEGELNYLITMLCQRYARQQARFGYDVANTIVGALECAKLEYYRRIVSLYENTKIDSNGDVY